MIPDKIYLNKRHPEPYWFKDKQVDSDIEYIYKDTLIEWLERKMTKEKATEGFVGGYDFALKCVINKINSM